jgi:3-hydroxyethyl bacteriochlorophyllide a dehydrogenase
MRTVAIEYPAKGHVAFKDIGAPPTPGASQVLVETVYSGITNGTERHALLAEHCFGGFPSCHGYQHVGRILQVGAAVTTFQPGQWVFYGAYVGHRGWHLIEVGTGPAAHSYQAHLLIPIPEGLDRQHCALMGVAGVALRGVRRCRVAPASNVWVVGQGLIGAFAAQAAKAYGARVTVSDVNPDRLERARQWGAHQLVDARDLAAARAAIAAQGPYDVILEGSGMEGLFEQVWSDRLLRHHGCVGLLAVRTHTAFHWPLLHSTEGSIEVSCHFDLDDLRVLLHFLQQGIIRVGPLLSHCVPIGAAMEIYGQLRDAPGALLGVVFDWQ